MTIADRNRLAELEKRVAELEALIKQLTTKRVKHGKID